jgi:hypothetical protein
VKLVRTNKTKGIGENGQTITGRWSYKRKVAKEDKWTGLQINQFLLHKKKRP